MKRAQISCLVILFNSCVAGLFCQNIPVIIEAENGIVGSEFEKAEENGVTYLSITTNGIGRNPGDAARILTLEVTFPAAQVYDLYIRCRVGSAGAEDDSFFYGNGFDLKSPTVDGDWIRVNNIYTVGYSLPNDYVDGFGGVGNAVWKWINLSEFTGDDPPITFEVTGDQLTRTFQLAAREDGLDIDKIAFARSDYFYTVSNLDNGEAGKAEREEGPLNLPIADGKSKFLGCVFANTQLAGFAGYWNQVTPENAGKWGRVEATRDNMNWTGLDRAYNYARDNDFYFKLHVLVWGNQQPEWIESLAPAEQLEEIKEWFQALADRYPEMDAIEVVNEPLHDPPDKAGDGGGNYINALGGQGTTGWDWVLEAFRLARQYFPKAKLMLNDYSIVNSSSATTDYLEIINLLKAENLIDQIGVQGHAFSTTASASVMKRNLDRLAESGLPIFVTELDIDGPTDEIQLREYQRIFPVFWEHPAVQGITLWGFRPGLWRDEQKAYLINLDGVTERPALKWLRTYVEGTVYTHSLGANADHLLLSPNPLTGSGVLRIRGIEGLQRAEVFKVDGTKVYETELQHNTIQLPGHLSKGLYILQLFDSQFRYVKKLIIQ